MTISFTGGQALPAYGTPAYTALVSAQNSGTSGAGNFNSSTGALTVNGQSIPTPAAGSTLADLANVPNTGKGTVSSSSSSIMGLNAQNAVTGTTVNQPQVDPNQKAADTYATFYNKQGYNINSADIMELVNNGRMSLDTAVQTVISTADKNQLKTDAEKQRQSELNSQANIHAQELAGSNATFAAARTKLEEQKRKDLEGAKAQAYANNPYAATSSTTSDYMGAVSREYAALDAQLTSQAEAAKAALEAGDGKTVAAINASMDSLLAQGQQNIANNLRDLQKTNIQQQQFDISKQQTATSQYQSALQNIPQAEIYQNYPDNWSDLTATQKTQIMNSDTFQVGLRANMSKDTLLSDIKNASSGAYKKLQSDISLQNAQTTAYRAQISAYTAQQKVTETEQAAEINPDSVLVTSTGYSYVDGTNFKGNSIINKARVNSQAVGAKFMNENQVKAVQNIDIVRKQLNMIKSDVAGKLGSDSWDRLITIPKNKFLTLTQADPTLATMNIYRDTGIAFVQAMVGGQGSGLRITQAEIDYQRGNIPTQSDTIQVAGEKIRKMEKFLYDKEGELFNGYKPVTVSTASTGTTYNIGGQEMSVGTQFQSSDGKTFSVGANGTPIPVSNPVSTSGFSNYLFQINPSFTIPFK